MLVHRRVTPSSKFAGTHLYTWVERGTMRVKCLAQEHNAVPRSGLEPGPPDPESSALTIRPPRLPHHKSLDCFNTQRNPFLIQASQKNTCQIFLPRIENFNSPKILRSSPSRLAIPSSPPPPPPLRLSLAMVKAVVR